MLSADESASTSVRALRAIIVSFVLLVPTAWHRYFIAGDLGSHVYNAWLAKLVREGRAPGLRLIRRTSNVLFDYLLDLTTHFFKFDVGARVAAGIAILIFFWSAFVLADSLSDGKAWRASPLIAVVAYGWVLETGFMNFFLGLGIGLLAIAMTVSRKYWLSALLFPFTWLAHPLASGIVIFMIGFVLLRRWTKWGIPIAILALCLGRQILGTHAAGSVLNHKPWDLTGADQMQLFNEGYSYLMYLVIAVIAIAFIQFGFTIERVERGVILRLSPEFAKLGIAAEYYVVAVCIAVWAPYAYRPPGYRIPLTMITPRITLFAAAVLGCVVAVTFQRSWQRVALCAIAGAFFLGLWNDTGALSAEAEKIAGTIGPVVATAPLGWRGRLSTEHITTGVCAGRCFVLDNYESPSGNFRVYGVLDSSKLDKVLLQDIH